LLLVENQIAAENLADEIYGGKYLYTELLVRQHTNSYASIPNNGNCVLPTAAATLTEGWQISFRIHNASSRIEPSLKFDINLVSAPHTLFTNHFLYPNFLHKISIL
jgi:HaeIII restriction endonuclease